MRIYRKLAGLGCALVAMVLVASQAFGQSSPRTIYWDSVGQRKWVPTGESPQFVFMGVDPANVIIRHEEHDLQGYFLIAEARPWGKDTSTFERGRAYCIPSDGTAPQLAASVDSSRRRTIVFTRI